MTTTRRRVGLAAALASPVLLAGCTSAEPTLTDLAGRPGPGTVVTVVDLEAVREETGDDLPSSLVSGLPGRPPLSSARLAPLAALEDFEPDGEDRFGPPAAAGRAERRLAAAVGVSAEGDGVLVAVAGTPSRVDEMLDGEQTPQDPEAVDLLDLDGAATRNAFPRGLDVGGGCQMVALTQAATDDRLVSVYLDGAAEADLSTDAGSALTGEVESTQETDGLLEVVVRPQSEGLRGASDILSSFGLRPVCDRG